MGEEKTNTLFPIFNPKPPAIARLAAQGSRVDGGHEVEFRSLESRSILNRTSSRRGLAFAWAINPYRGCEFGCRYCYARYTHEFMELREPADFERLIYIKQNAAWLLRQELRAVRAGEEIAVGTATDPYQPIERRAAVTRSLLAVLAEQQDLRIGLITKSTLIDRDIPLLRQIAQRNTLVLHQTITTPDARLARMLEPRAPRPDLRFRTVLRLRAAGLTAGILCSPLLPGITDTASALNVMASRAREAGASFFAAAPLFLKPCSRPVFLAFIEQNFPALREQYAQHYNASAFVAAPYRSRVASLIAAVCRKHGLAQRSTDAILTGELGVAAPRPPQRQGELWPARRDPPNAHSG